LQLDLARGLGFGFAALPRRAIASWTRPLVESRRRPPRKSRPDKTAVGSSSAVRDCTRLVSS
jgi:hypothetical protein